MPGISARFFSLSQVNCTLFIRYMVAKPVGFFGRVHWELLGYRYLFLAHFAPSTVFAWQENYSPTLALSLPQGLSARNWLALLCKMFRPDANLDDTPRRAYLQPASRHHHPNKSLLNYTGLNVKNIPK